MIPASTIAKLAALGLSSEQTAAVAEMMAEVEAATEDKAAAAISARRTADRERQAKRRHVMSRDNASPSRDVTLRHVTSCDTADGPSPDKERSPRPPKEINPSHSATPHPREGGSVDDAGRPPDDEIRSFLCGEVLAGGGMCKPNAAGIEDLSPIHGLIDADYDLRREIGPTIRSRSRGRQVATWAYFVEAVHESRVTRLNAAAARSRDGPAPGTGTTIVDSFIAAGEKYFR